MLVRDICQNCNGSGLVLFTNHDTSEVGFVDDCPICREVKIVGPAFRSVPELLNYIKDLEKECILSRTWDECLERCDDKGAGEIYQILIEARKKVGLLKG